MKLKSLKLKYKRKNILRTFLNKERVYYNIQFVRARLYFINREYKKNGI